MFFLTRVLLNKLILTAVALLLMAISNLTAQGARLHGQVKTDELFLPGVSIFMPELDRGAITDDSGAYEINQIPDGEYIVKVSYLGFATIETKIHFSEGTDVAHDFILKDEVMKLDEVVVSGTRTFKRKTDSPVIVNILDSKTLNNLQVCNLSEGLKFQPGLRIETDCQTCNYTQLRMNGLQGGYSQILINGRPIFSPLMGLYGMEQLPVNMIERIEVVRGGGSSLYGSSAIGGTVNVITKLPQANGFEINSFYQNIDGQTNDFNFNGNATILNNAKNAGVSLFLSKRDRGLYDANSDNFSELPKLENTSLGLNAFFNLSENQKLEFSLSRLQEYRFGGEMILDIPAHLTQQAEERTHKIWMGSADYQINFNQDKSSLIFYSAFQHTDRDHYTGVFPDEDDDIMAHLENPPYGFSSNTTLQGGFQLNHAISDFFNTRNVLTFGTEYISDKVLDNIPSYNYLVDQHTRDLGMFFQSDWDFAENFNLLSGVRIDHHNLVDRLVYSPRVALMYKMQLNTQFRFSFGTGFRAPQAFDTDLHIAFADGGVSRVQLDEDLREERSRSYSLSINHDHVSERWIVGFTLEGFRTELDHAFILENVEEDDFGQVFIKRNGQSALVKGLTLELRANYNRRLQLESGITVQRSEFAEPVEYIQELSPVQRFLRTPDQYGYANLSITPNDKWSFNVNMVFTGKMLLAHFGGADNFTDDAIVTVDSFSEVNTRAAYTFPSLKSKMRLQIYGGVKNLFNAYQRDFDVGKNRDSNYIYGPAMPRTIFLGFKVFM